MLLMKIVYSIFIVIMGFQLIFTSYFEMGILFIVMGFIVFISGVSKIPQYDCLDGELYKLENRNYLKQNQKCELLNQEIYVRNSEGNLIRPYDLKEALLKY